MSVMASAANLSSEITSRLPTANPQRSLKVFVITARLSLHRDDDLAVLSACTITTKGFPRFAQLIRAVDYGRQLSGFKTFVQVWQVPVLLQHDQADSLACGLPNAPSEHYK